MHKFRISIAAAVAGAVARAVAAAAAAAAVAAAVLVAGFEATLQPQDDFPGRGGAGAVASGMMNGEMILPC